MIQEAASDIAHRLGIAGALVLASCAQCIVASSEASGDFEEFLLHREHHHRSIGLTVRIRNESKSFRLLLTISKASEKCEASRNALGFATAAIL